MDKYGKIGSFPGSYSPIREIPHGLLDKRMWKSSLKGFISKVLFQRFQVAHYARQIYSHIQDGISTL